MKYIAKYGGSPLGRHTTWLREAKIDDSDPAAFAHEVLSEFFELLLCYDMLDASNLACVERLARWYQDLEGQKEPAEAKGASDAYASGMARAAGGVAYCPELRKYVTTKVGEEMAILKEKRKAREERALARAKK
jgi:hypothetical protein